MPNEPGAPDVPSVFGALYYRNYPGEGEAVVVDMTTITENSSSVDYNNGTVTYNVYSLAEVEAEDSNGLGRSWSPPSGMMFKEWNTLADGTGTTYGSTFVDSVGTMHYFYAIWEDDIDYMAKKSEIRSVADAIRTKGSTSASLEFPSGFVSAIQSMPASSWKLIGSSVFTVNSSSTSASNIGTVSCYPSAYTASKIIYVRSRRATGKANGQYAGNDDFLINYYALDAEPTSNFTAGLHYMSYWTSGGVGRSMNQTSSNIYGIYASNILTSGNVSIARRWNSNFGSAGFNGDYIVEVYALDYPDGRSVYDGVEQD